VTAAHLFGETADAVAVLSFGAEILPGDKPVGALAGAGRLDVGWLLTCLPSAGHDQCAGDSCSLRAVDVLRITETQPGEVITGERALASGDIELDQHTTVRSDIEHFSAAAVLDAFLACLVVLVDERYPIALAHPIVNSWHRDFYVA
jgi:hypothetical protein